MASVIQGLWIGPALSVMEQLSIASFVRHGHRYHLYTYGDVAHVPPGAEVRDGNEILPESMIFQYANRPSYAAFSNFFRYKLLLENGGWWADTDVVCLKPFAFDTDYVFASEWWHERGVIASGTIRVPAGSEVMRYAWARCCEKDRAAIRWGEIGPRLMDEAVRRCGLEAYVRPAPVFSPIGFRDWAAVLDPSIDWTFDETTHAIHLWNEMWRQDGPDKNGSYPPGCLYERLKKDYLDG